jgi:hypothetical protein
MSKILNDLFNICNSFLKSSRVPNPRSENLPPPPQPPSSKTVLPQLVSYAK